MYKTCRNGHLMLPNNVIWSKRKNGKHQRQCRKCFNHQRRNSPKRRAYNKLKWKRKAAKIREQTMQIKKLNVSGIIQGMMQCLS